MGGTSHIFVPAARGASLVTRLIKTVRGMQGFFRRQSKLRTRPRAGLEMNETTPTTTAQHEPLPAKKKQPVDARPRASRAPSIIVGVVIVAIAGLSIWYLVRPQPLL